MTFPRPMVLLACASMLVPSLVIADGGAIDASASPDTGSAADAPAALDVPPELVSFVEADYPADALREGREGTVRLELTVNEQGTVDSVVVLDGLDPGLDDAAVDAAARFRFRPARMDGEPVAVIVEYAYVFALTDATRDLADVVNFTGRLVERGTRDPITEAMVVAAFPDSLPRPGLAVPLSAHLARIGGFDGQHREGDRLVTFTDSTGAFAFRSLPPGAVELTFPNAGYLGFVAAETIAPDDSLHATYRLTRAAYDEYEIVVYGHAEEREVSRQRLTVTEVEKLPGFGGDVIKSVQAFPSVARPSLDDGGAVIVRGSGVDDTRFLLEGIDIPLLFHFGGLKSTYNSLSLASVDLYPGGYGVRYGDVVGGIVTLTGRPAKMDRWHTTLDASLLDASFHTEGPIGKGWGLTLTGRRSFAGEVASAVFAEVDELDMSIAPYYWDVVARLDREISPRERLFVTTIAAGDRMEMIFPDAAEGSAEVNEATDAIEAELTFSRLIVGYDRPITATLQNSLRLAAGHGSEEGHVFGEFDWRVEGPVYQIRDELTYAPSRRMVANLGVDVAYTPLEYEVTSVGWPTSRRREEFTDLGVYGELELQPIDRLVVTPGLRYDHYVELDEGAPSLRLASRYRLTDDHTLTGSVGSYNQSPEPRGQATDPVFGNPDLPPTRALQVTLGDEWRISDRLSLETEAYFTHQTDIPAITDSAGANFLPDAEGRMYGIELMLRHDPGNRFFGWISYSLSRSERRFERRPEVPGESASGSWDADRWVPHTYDQTHRLDAVASYRIGANWSAGVRAQYVTGNPETRILSLDGDRFIFDADTGDYVPVSGDYLGGRLDPHVRVDVRVDRTFVRTNYLASVYLDLQNVGAFAYDAPEGYTYRYDYSARDAYGWLPMPSLGVRVEF